MPSKWSSTAPLIGLAVFALAPLSVAAQETPDDFEQILPRGRISSIDQPQWTTAEDADVPDDAWMLGYVIDGRARAISVNLLNAHEVVNDEMGGVHYAAVW